MTVPMLERALDAIEAEIGDAAVERSDEYLAQFRDPYRAVGEVAHGPSAVVYPGSTAEVQSVVRIAASFGVTLHVSSQGRNFGYGGAEPRVDGAIALSLRRLTRVFEINDELGYADIGPGVTFFDLDAALRAGKHDYMIAAPDLGWGSVIGNALDHGIGYTSRGDHFGNLCGLEVVLADGSVVRTGMGGMTDSPNWHVSKRGFGPSLDGLFGQSNLGIVTRAGVWLAPTPQCYARIQVAVPRLDDIAPLVDIVRPLMLDGTIRSFPSILHGFSDLAVRLPRGQWPPMRGFGSEAELASVLSAHSIGMWTLRASLYGRPESVAADTAHLEEAFSKIDGSTFTAATYLPPYTEETVAPPHWNGAGIPSLNFLQIFAAWGGREHGGHIDFSPVTPLTGQHVLKGHRIISEVFARHDVQATPVVITRERSAVHVSMVMYDTRDSAAIARVRAAWTEAEAAMAEHGYGLYRGHSDFADEVAGRYSFENHSLAAGYHRLKDALDPAGILSPGKQGVWPARLRE